MKGYQITILEMPGTLEWGIFKTNEQPNTFYRFKLENNEVLVEKQAYIQSQNGTHYMGGIGSDLYRALSFSLIEELKARGTIKQS